MRFFWKKSNKGEHAKSGRADEAKAVHVGQRRELSAEDPCKNQNKLGSQIRTALTKNNDQNPNLEVKGEHQLVADLEHVNDSDIVQLPKLARCAVAESNFNERTRVEGSTPPEASCSAEVAPKREPSNDEGTGLHKVSENHVRNFCEHQSPSLQSGSHTYAGSRSGRAAKLRVLFVSAESASQKTCGRAAFSSCQLVTVLVPEHLIGPSQQ